MVDRLGLRLDEVDRRRLITVAAALNAKVGTEASLPWSRSMTLSRTVRLAFAIAAEAVEAGTAGAMLERAAGEARR